MLPHHLKSGSYCLGSLFLSNWAWVLPWMGPRPQGPAFRWQSLCVRGGVIRDSCPQKDLRPQVIVTSPTQGAVSRPCAPAAEGGADNPAQLSVPPQTTSLRVFQSNSHLAAKTLVGCLLQTGTGTPCTLQCHKAGPGGRTGLLKAAWPLAHRQGQQLQSLAPSLGPAQMSLHPVLTTGLTGVHHCPHFIQED